MGKLFGPSFRELAEKEFELRRRQKNKQIVEGLNVNQKILEDDNDRKASLSTNKPLLTIIRFLLPTIISISIFLWSLPFGRSEGITYVEFNKIENGMSYTEVITIIGSKGKLLSSVDLNIAPEFQTQIYLWYGSNDIATATIKFQGGKVTMKTHFGLN